MSGGNPKRYPRSLESNYSLLRIRAPEHLDVALEGLIRKVLKEQPKMDDIYQFAADYFDMLLKIREKAGVRKLTVQDICPHHNEEDAHEMIKVASSFTKRKKEPKQYRVLSLRNGERNKHRKFENFELDDGMIGVQNEIPELNDAPIRKTENEEAKKEEKFEKKEESENEIEPDYSSKVSTEDTGEQIFIKANEVVTAYNKGEDTPNEALESNIDKIGDINEIRDKIKAVENEIELLGKKGDESVDKQFQKDEGKTSSENEVETGEGSGKESNTEKEKEMTEQDQANETVEDESGTKTQESNQGVSDEREVPPEAEITGGLQPDSKRRKSTNGDMEENQEIKTETRAETEEASQVEERIRETLQDAVTIENEKDEENQRHLERSLEMQPEAIAETEEDKNEVCNMTHVTEARKMQTVEQEKGQRENDNNGDEPTETQEDSAVLTEAEKEEKDGDNKEDEPTETQEDSAVLTEAEKEEKEFNETGAGSAETQGGTEVTTKTEEEQKEDKKELEGAAKTQDVEDVTEMEKEEKQDDKKAAESAETQGDTEVMTEVENEKEEDIKIGESTETQGGIEVTTEVEKEEKDEAKEGEESAKVQGDSAAVLNEEINQGEKEKEIEAASKTQDVSEVEKEEKEEQKQAEEPPEAEPEAKKGEKGDDEKIYRNLSNQSTETQDSKYAPEKEKEGQEDDKKGGEPAKAQGDIEVITELENEKEENRKIGEPMETQGGPETEAEIKKEEQGGDDKEGLAKTHEDTEVSDVKKKQENQKEKEKPKVEPEEEKENKGEEKKEEGSRETQGDAENAAEVNKEEKEVGKKEEPAECQGDTEAVPEEGKELKEDQKGYEELTQALGDTERKEKENQKEINMTDLDMHLTTAEEKKEQTVQKSSESHENIQRDTEEQKTEENSPEEAEVSEKTQANIDIGAEAKENEVEDQKYSEEILDGKPDIEDVEEKRLEKSPESQKYDSEITENESGRETDAVGNSELKDVQQETSPTEKNDESSDSVPASTEKEEDRKVGEEGRRETLKGHITNIGTQIIGNASQALISQEIRNDVDLKEVKKKEKETLFGNELDKAEATSIQDFLSREREYSSYDKQGIDMKDSASQENSVESEIKSRYISVLGLTYGKELNTDNASVKVSVEEPDDAIDVAADDYQERDTSTTSDEIEFEISPVKYPEAEQASQDKDEQSNVKVEPEIVVDLQTEDSVIKKEQDNESKDDTGKTFLQVPETALEEYHVRKEPIVEEPPEGEEVILGCSNIGNEIIQTGEVEKVELLEGEEDILQVHLTTTIEAEQSEGDSVSVEISSIEPNFKVYVETKVESPSQHSGNEEKLRMFRAAVVIQNGFRRFKNRKHSRELQFSDKPVDEENGETESKLEAISSLKTSSQDIGTTVSTKTSQKEKSLNRGTTRTLLETRSLEPSRKISPLKTRSLSTGRHGVGDFEVWNQLVQELEEAARKIQSNYRGYTTRKKLQRGNAIQSATITSEESDVPEYNQSHTGEFHDSIVLPYHPK